MIRGLLLAALVAAAGCSAVTPGSPPRQGDQPRDEARDSIQFDDEGEAPELPLQLPPPPDPSALIEFDGGRRGSLRFFVDPQSLTLGSDRIVRFTLVARGEGSATNVSYEGVRCASAERKVYAYAQTDGKWLPVKDPTWRKIASADGHRFVLYTDYFCPARQGIASEREGIEALRKGGHPRARDMLAPGTMVR